CIAADRIVPLPVAIQAEENQVGFWKIDGECAVRHHIDDEKSHLLRFENQVAERVRTVFPEKGFPAAEKQNAYAHIVKLPHFISDLPVWMDNPYDIVDKTMPAMQIA